MKKKMLFGAMTLLLLITACKYKKADKMDENEFWKLIEYTKNYSLGSQDRQESLLMEQLASYEPQEIIDFEIILRKFLIRANDYKVLAAAKIINDDIVTDDPFLYFRCWLISQGKEIFYGTLENPDCLADITTKHAEDGFESLLYISTRAFKMRTGKKDEDESFPRSIAYDIKQLDYDDISLKIYGKDWKDEDLPKLYPKLYAKFH